MQRFIGIALVLVLLVGCAVQDNKPGGERGVSAAERYNQMGVEYMRQGELEVALERFQRALELNPKLVDAHIGIAYLYRQINEPDEALSHYKKAVSLAPERADVLNNYGTYLCQNDKPEQAIDLFLAAAESPFYETPEVALGNAGICAMQFGRMTQAEKYLRASLEGNARQPGVLLSLAELYAEQKNWMKARAFLQRYESMSRMAPGTLALAYEVETELGDERSAADYRERLLNDFPESEQAKELSAKL